MELNPRNLHITPKFTSSGDSAFHYLTKPSSSQQQRMKCALNSAKLSGLFHNPSVDRL
jgi:hypothetical protein